MWSETGVVHSDIRIYLYRQRVWLTFGKWMKVVKKFKLSLSILAQMSISHNNGTQHVSLKSIQGLCPNFALNL